jgi:hypothetical protein
MNSLFIGPSIASVLGLAAIYWWGGVPALLLSIALAVLEVTLSFDNAVVNAKILTEMPPHWQKRFLTWGIVFSVFGTRLVLPILIVSVIALASPLLVATMAFNNPVGYAVLLSGAESTIKAFGGAFLLMVSLKFFFNISKKVHWFSPLERRLTRWGRVEAIEIALALVVVLGVSYFAHSSVENILRAGIIGLILFTLTEGVAHGLGMEAQTGSVARSGFSHFVYINILDTAFSLDGVIGAFALTTSLPIIVVGLGIGAYFVRALTMYLVEHKTLQSLRYLEHGAHWAIFGLALSMFAGLIVHVPEAFTGTIGLAFVGLAFFSSRRAMRSQELAETLG